MILSGADPLGWGRQRVQNVKRAPYDLFCHLCRVGLRPEPPRQQAWNREIGSERLPVKTVARALEFECGRLVFCGSLQTLTGMSRDVLHILHDLAPCQRHPPWIFQQERK